MKKLLYAIVLMLVPFGLTAQVLQNQATENQAEIGRASCRERVYCEV